MERKPNVRNRGASKRVVSDVWLGFFFITDSTFDIGLQARRKLGEQLRSTFKVERLHLRIEGVDPTLRSNVKNPPSKQRNACKHRGCRRADVGKQIVDHGLLFCLTSKMSHAAVDVRPKTDLAKTQGGRPRWLWRLVRPEERIGIGHRERN